MMVRRRIVLLILACWGSWTVAGYSLADSRAAEPLIGEIVIDIADMPGDTAPLAETARGLIYLKAGDRFSAEKFQHSLEALKQSGIFRAIDIPDPDWDRPEITLTFRLTPFRRIRDIRISGAFPLFEKEVLNAMTFYTGDVLVAEKLADQEKNIARLFINEGYVAPEVSVTAKEDPADGHYVVDVEIGKGDFYRIERVGIRGNRAFSAARLKMRLSTWKSSRLPAGMSRFIQKELDRDTRNLTEFYRKKGYADVVVRPMTEKDRNRKTVSVFFIVEEGPRYKISFEGHKAFWRFTLKKDLVLARRGNKGDMGLRKSIRNIRERYHRAGYLSARVKTEEEMSDDQRVRKIRLIIDEGPQSVVGSVAIEGNEAFDDERIGKQMLTRLPGVIGDGEFVPEVLEEDKGAISALYLKQGYTETRVTDRVRIRDDEAENKKRAAVSLTIGEGVQTRTEAVSFQGLSVLSQADALDGIALKPGEPFRKYMVRSDENTLAAMISEKGYPHVRVTGAVAFSPDKSGATLTYTVDEGPYVEMGEVFVTGNFRTRRQIFLNETELEPGAPFSLIRMLEAQRNIRNISALDTANFKTLGLKEEADRVNLLVEAEEKKPYYFQIGGGYDTAREFFINSAVGDHNLFGLNRDAWICGEYSQIGYRAEAGITEPRFMGTRISSTTSAFAEEKEEFNKDFGIRTMGASQVFSRKFRKYFDASLSFRYEYREQYRTDPDKAIPAGDEDKYDPRSILVTTPSLRYNSTDSFIRPRKGLYALAAVDISKGLGDTLDDFFKYRFEGRYYYTPLERLTLALRGRYGYIDPFSSASNIPDDQLFFLGGTADVRGFDENKLRFDDAGDPLGGRTEILGSLEARFDLGMNFELAAFYDVGSIRNTLLNEGADDFRSSAGLGLRYITPIGPIGFLYGWKLDKEPGESGGKLHFTLGYTF
ncbi:outer membrane protein assembly factor BamA [Desulfonema ishimotonii]|uniref:Outer membrane protein assembly factor BamA n=1 Tax=Desulfonema ishimotonii TaxID=45657 RepID=A0A401G1I5_9BACT|nr:outer membrane protein assembly factor BamA [Desulfonema ishimotonii]GBC63079.1 outer membrane protein assembly factor BamA [Desulfonema ishimotonii]